MIRVLRRCAPADWREIPDEMKRDSLVGTICNIDSLNPFRTSRDGEFQIEVRTTLPDKGTSVVECYGHLLHQLISVDLQIMAIAATFIERTAFQCRFHGGGGTVVPTDMKS